MSKLPTSNSEAAREAREQAEAYDSLLRSSELALDDGTVMMIPPHPNLGMWDDDRQAEYEELLFEIESYDRHPDILIPEQRLRDKDGNETGVVLPSETKRGDLLRPFRKDGQLIKPPHSVRVVMAALGEDGYKQLRAGGRAAADVWRIWNLQGVEMKARQDVDNKSAGRDLDLAAVPEADSK